MNALIAMTVEAIAVRIYRVVRPLQQLCGEVVQTSAHSTGSAVVPIRVPTPITTSTRSSIHFIDKKPRLAAGPSNPLANGEDLRLL